MRVADRAAAVGNDGRDRVRPDDQLADLAQLELRPLRRDGDQTEPEPRVVQYEVVILALLDRHGVHGADREAHDRADIPVNADRPVLDEKLDLAAVQRVVNVFLEGELLGLPSSGAGCGWRERVVPHSFDSLQWCAAFRGSCDLNVSPKLTDQNNEWN